MDATIDAVPDRRAGLIEALHRSRAEELDELHREHRATRHGSLVLHWLGGWLRRTPRAAAEPLPDVAHGEVGITWAGHATALVRYADLAIACDPMLGRRLGMIRRAVQPGLGPAELVDVELILVTSSDPDHLHIPTLRRLPRKATVVVPPRCAGLVSDLGFARVVELGIGQSLSHRRVDVTSCPVAHESAAGRPSCGYALRGDGPSVYFCGGSGYFSGFTEVGRRHRPDVALLPIAGYVPRSFRRRHMSPLDALYAFEDLGSRMLIPIRHGTFALSYETLDEPLEWLKALVRERDLEAYVSILAPGSSRKFSVPAPDTA